MKISQQPQHVHHGTSDSLSGLYQAHTTLAHIMEQVDKLVMKVHKNGSCMQLSSLDLSEFSQFLMGVASSLQAWVSRFEDVAQGGAEEAPEHSERDNLACALERGEGDEMKADENGKLGSHVSSGNLLDATIYMEEENLLSDSPLVPWLDRAEFFVLTPMATKKKPFSSALLRKCSLEEQELLSHAVQSTPPPQEECMKTRTAPAKLSASFLHKSYANQEESQPVTCSLSTSSCMARHPCESPAIVDVANFPCKSSTEGYSTLLRSEDFAVALPMLIESPQRDAESVETIIAPALMVPPEVLSKFPGKEQDSVATESALSTPSSTVQCCWQNPHAEDVTTPSPPQSLVKRYFNRCQSDASADVLAMVLDTPAVEQSQASLHKPAKALVSEEIREETSLESIEYFTAFSPPRSIAVCTSLSRKGAPELLSPPNQAASSTQGLLLYCVEQTPQPPQSLMKRYSQFFHADKDNDEFTDSITVLTPVLTSSPPKTCILMRPNQMNNALKQPRRGSQTPLFLLKSPFRTPGLFLRKVGDLPSCEDMDLTSLKKPGQQLLRPWDSVKKTPSSDMQFTTMMKSQGCNRSTPFVDLQLSTVRKPGVPLPGEQTLKRELWCRMEAEFASMTHVCKSLFADGGEAEVSGGPGAGGRVAPSGKENKELFVPRGLQQRGLHLCN